MLPILYMFFPAWTDGSVTPVTPTAVVCYTPARVDGQSEYAGAVIDRSSDDRLVPDKC